MSILFRTTLCALALLLVSTGCKKSLDLVPQNEVTSETVFKNSQGYFQAMAKVYGCMALTGNQGPAGSPDVTGDEGFSDFVRQFWQLQQLPTDECIITWGDAGLPDFHNMQWTASNGFIGQLYARSYFQITLVNQFLEEAADGRLSDRGISGGDADIIRDYRNEARFLRAFQYWVVMDLFGKGPFSTQLSAENPPEYSRAQLFKFIEDELKAIEPLLKERNDYGRVTRAAARALLARMYLNAEVYTGTPRYADAATYAKLVIDEGGYTLINNYRDMMLANNDQRAASEFILTVNYDGLRTQTYGGMTYLVNASNSQDQYNIKFGRADGDTVRQHVSYGTGGWNGLKLLAPVVDRFPDSGFGADKRAQFLRQSINSRGTALVTRTKTIKVLGSALQGYRCYKYRNVTSDTTQTPGSDPGKTYCDGDFPLFRLAEMYLIYAEAALHGGGDIGLGTEYINRLRTRAYGDASGNITSYDLPFILDERGRELYWEGHRRTDLVRFGKFTTGYNWPFKGGQVAGKDVDDHFKIYPLPLTDVTTNPNLRQNPGY